MKNIVISADGDRKVYSVPNAVADNLAKYCSDFIGWMKHSPDAKIYRIGGALCYDEEDFIKYLNVLFPKEKSIFIQNLGWVDFGSKLPQPYENCPAFNF